MQAGLNLPSELILASKSPRRSALLRQAGLSFKVVPSNIDEALIPRSQTSPAEYVLKLAEAKAADVSEKYPDSWVIGADTIVVFENDILGKPRSRDDARRMLSRLSGQAHQVLTGYAISHRAGARLFSETVTTQVHFKDLAEKEIEWYIRTTEPFDKAGAYAIQELGTFLVKRISGSYTNVVGLPICEVIDFFYREGLIEFDFSSRPVQGGLNLCMK